MKRVPSWLWLLPDEEKKRTILEAIVRTSGCIIQAAYQLGYPRSKLYDRINELELWPAINEIRKEHNEDKTLRKHRHRFQTN